MKKRKGVSLPKSLRQSSTSYSAPGIVRRARDFPLIECWISSSWKQQAPGLVQIIVARQQPDDQICFGVFLVDKLCLGLKNTFSRANYTLGRYQEEVERLNQQDHVEKCSPDLAFQLIYDSIDYAAQFGFEPQKDFDVSQFMLPPREEVSARQKFKFGQNGKPLFIPGPNDNAKAIVAKLEQNPGHGNYDYIVMGPSF